MIENKSSIFCHYRGGVCNETDSMIIDAMGRTPDQWNVGTYGSGRDLIWLVHDQADADVLMQRAGTIAGAECLKEVHDA